MQTQSEDLNSDIVDVNNRIIYLQENSGNDNPGIDYETAQNFVRSINTLQQESTDPITVYMQTIGGCWYSGMGIYDSIKISSCDVTIIGYGQVCSMGTIIMQAASHRFLMPNCVFMCHYGSTQINADFLSLQNYAQLEKTNMHTMLDIYAERCFSTGAFFKNRQYSQSKVKLYIKRKMKDGDWYMTAPQAVEMGFADQVLSL
jgi:ATP-dependent Clp protease protease subunit